MTNAHSTPATDIRRASERFHTDLGWLDSWHSFSFGNHHDRANVAHGLLIVSNDDRVAAGGGFGAHPHRDMEIVTWVLAGSLRHNDSQGNDGVLYPGLAQRMSAGSGIIHSEYNASDTEAAHFVQMWVVPSEPAITPSYEQTDVNEALDAGGWVAVASGQGHEGAVAIHQPGAVMWVARMAAGDQLEVPNAPYVHLFTARGTLALGEDTLEQGDAVRFTNAGSPTIEALEPSEVIVWATDAMATRG